MVDLKAISEVGMNDDIGILVNASRSIIFASSGEDFAEAATLEAKKVADEMKEIISTRYS